MNLPTALFQLRRDSPCVNKGVIVPGVNDGAGTSECYHGRAPDIGAVETLFLRRT